VQHDTSIHLWSPQAEKKWYLITTIDDYSRRILYGDFWGKETSWSHIVALKTVVNTFGCPTRYYVDNHSIFRFIERRDSLHKKTDMKESEAVVQWKEVLNDLNIEVVYAQLPAAKGKIERPYQWLQDHIVRTCVRENITKIEDAREILYEEINRYNYKRVHSTTKEIPVIRYEKALEERRSLFRAFEIKSPYEKREDIFCFRIKRVVNAYRKISLHTLEFSISGVSPRREVECRISIDAKTGMAIIRFWYNHKCVGEQKVKADDLKGLHF